MCGQHSQLTIFLHIFVSIKLNKRCFVCPANLEGNHHELAVELNCFELFQFQVEEPLELCNFETMNVIKSVIPLTGDLTPFDIWSESH